MVVMVCSPEGVVSPVGDADEAGGDFVGAGGGSEVPLGAGLEGGGQPLEEDFPFEDVPIRDPVASTAGEGNGFGGHTPGWDPTATDWDSALNPPSPAGVEDDLDAIELSVDSPYHEPKRPVAARHSKHHGPAARYVLRCPPPSAPLRSRGDGDGKPSFLPSFVGWHGSSWKSRTRWRWRRGAIRRPSGR